MARGDIVNGVAAVAASAYLNYQPAAGVEVMITLASLARAVGTAIGVILCWSGDLNSKVFGANTSAAVTPELNMRMFINNSNYFSIYNGEGASLNAGYSGIQTK